MKEAQKQTNEVGLICGKMKINIENDKGEIFRSKIKKVVTLKIHMSFCWLIQVYVLEYIEFRLYEASADGLQMTHMKVDFEKTCELCIV